MQENFDKVEEFIKKRYDERENTRKKKRKFRAMTVSEYCFKRVLYGCCKDCLYCYNKLSDKVFCTCKEFNGILKGGDASVTPYKTKDGKFILIEVEE